MNQESIAHELSAVINSLSGCHLIGGGLVRPAGGRTFPVVSPSTGRPIGVAALGDAADVGAAVRAAARAQHGWAETAPRQRGKLVQECGRVLAAHSEEIARLLALETGKALRTES